MASCRGDEALILIFFCRVLLEIFNKCWLLFQMATVIHHSRNKPSDAYGCNWLERLKQIKRVRSKAVAENQGPVAQSSLGSAKGATSAYKSTDAANSDFTDYT